MVEAELEEVDLRIAELQQQKAELNGRRAALLRRLEDACRAAGPSASSSSSSCRPSPATSEQELQRFDGTGTVNPPLRSTPPPFLTSPGFWCLFGRLPVVGRGGAAPEGHLPPAHVQGAAAQGRQPDAVGQGPLPAHAHGKREEPVLPAAGALLHR